MIDKPHLGYTTGVFDLFHVGHVNLLRNAKALCETLVVGVSTDELVAYKGKSPVIPFEERVEVVRACRYVDSVVPQDVLDKQLAWTKLKFDALFVGDDWHNHPSWRKFEEDFAPLGVRVIYFPYTKGRSSTLINNTLTTLRADGETNGDVKDA